MKNIFFVFLLFLSTLSFSQVGIGTTSPDASSVLDITATDAGLLVPRLTTTQRDALSSPATGLLIFNTTTKSFQYNFGDGSSVDWYSLDAQSDTSSSSSISGLIAASTGALIAGSGYTSYGYGTGRYRITFSSTPSNANYTVLATSNTNETVGNEADDTYIRVTNKTTTSFDIWTTREDDGGGNGRWVNREGSISFIVYFND